MRRDRRGTSIMEVIIASLLVAAVLAPVLGTIGRQSDQAKFARDRVIAVQLANDVLEMMTERGYVWMRSSARLGPSAVGLGDSPPATSLRMDTTVGASQTIAAPFWGVHWAENALNPALSGPGIGDPNTQFNNGLSVDVFWMQNARDTFAARYGFSRRVEIWGGRNMNEPGFGAGTGDCYRVRVTISSTTLSASMGPGDADRRYQVVTWIGRRSATF